MGVMVCDKKLGIPDDVDAFRLDFVENSPICIVEAHH